MSAARCLLRVARSSGTHRHLLLQQVGGVSGSSRRTLHFGLPRLQSSGGTSDAPAEPNTSHWFIKMPSISDDEKFGKVLAWRKKEGEKVKTGDQLCEVEFSAFSINLTMEEDSYVAQIMVPAGDGMDVPVGTPLCALVEKEEDIPAFKAAHAPKAKEKDFGFTQKDIMMAINHMLKEGQIDEELAGQLSTLARHENMELWEAFDGSFKADTFSEEGLAGLDTSFLLLQARDIVREVFKKPQEPVPAADGDAK